MLEDPFIDIAQCRKLGDQIVLMIYFNEKITSYTVTKLFTSVGFTEDITHQHCATGLVTTHQRVSHLIYGTYNLSAL